MLPGAVAMATPVEEVVAVDDTDAPEVSESLYGLMGALEKMKDVMGVTAENTAELAQVEQLIAGLHTENEQLQRYAEEAIVVRTYTKQSCSCTLFFAPLLRVHTPRPSP